MPEGPDLTLKDSGACGAWPPTHLFKSCPHYADRASQRELLFSWLNGNLQSESADLLQDLGQQGHEKKKKKFGPPIGGERDGVICTVAAPFLHGAKSGMGHLGPAGWVRMPYAVLRADSMST